MTPEGLRLGEWERVLADVAECDTLYSDPPFSARTHDGYRSGDDFNHANRIGYSALTEGSAHDFAAAWAPRVNGWVVLHCDHVAFRWHEAAWLEAGFYAFQPVPWLKVDAGPRAQGDGPAVGAEYLFVARTKGWPAGRGSRPPWYEVQVNKESGGPRIVGAKRVQDVRRVVVDYSQPGDLIVDPFAGLCSIGCAAVETGRRYVGSEVDAETFAVASRRLAGASVPLPGVALPDRWPVSRRQGVLDFGGDPDA